MIIYGLFIVVFGLVVVVISCILIIRNSISLRRTIYFINKPYHRPQSLYLHSIPLCCLLIFPNLLSLFPTHLYPNLLLINQLQILLV